MKLVIQIPCRDEVENLAPVVEDLPAEIPGVDEIETLVIDDGSTDGTAEKAIDLGVDHVLRFEVNRGLARTFSTGLRFSQVIGGDVIINTDGDHQYQGSYVTDFVKHLQSSTAAMVVGARDIKKIPHFSRTKKILQHLGSKVVGFLAGYPIPDAPCGFRAFTKSAASKLTNHTQYTYTLETLIQAPLRGIKVDFIPIETNSAPTRKSRLMKSMSHYLMENLRSLIVIVLLYKPIWVGVGGTALALLAFAGSLCSYFWFPSAFMLLFILGVALFMGGGAFALLAQILLAGRIQVEEALFYLTPVPSPAECAERLGVTAYYHKGEKVFPVG